MKKTAGGNITTLSDAKEAKTAAFNKERYGEVIRTYRKRANLTQAQLGTLVGASGILVGHWEAGRARPDLNLVPALCESLGISLGVFFGKPASDDALSEEEQRFMAKYRRIGLRDRLLLQTALDKMYELATDELWSYCRENFRPIWHNYQQAAAGSGITLESENQGEQVYIRNGGTADRADEIVTVNGASMEPRFYDGQDVYVEHTQELQIGEIGLFIVNGAGYIKELANGYLHSLNPAFEDIRICEDDDLRCVGRILGVVDVQDYPSREEEVVLAEIAREGK